MTSMIICGQLPPVTSKQSLVNRQVPSAFAQVAARRSVSAKAGEQQASLTGEWSANWSLASYEDVGEYFNDNLFKEEAAPGSLLRDIMSTDTTVATPDTTVEDLKTMLSSVTGLPVVQSTTDRKLVGVVSKGDLSKAGRTVGEIMSTPPVASRADAKVADAAVLMLKFKVHRIPIVDGDAKVVGIVTRTDIFTALALDSGSTDILGN